MTISALKSYISRKRKYYRAYRFNTDRKHQGVWKAWMCPTCNKVHKHTSWNCLDGLQYPACCTFAEGHRLHYRLHATKL